MRLSLLESLKRQGSGELTLVKGQEAFLLSTHLAWDSAPAPLGWQDCCCHLLKREPSPIGAGKTEAAATRRPSPSDCCPPGLPGKQQLHLATPR